MKNILWNKNYPRYQFFVERKLKIKHNKDCQCTAAKCCCNADIKSYINVFYRYDNLSEKVQIFKFNKISKIYKWTDCTSNGDFKFKEIIK